MRLLVAILLTVPAGWGQFKSTVPLVVAPTTVTDSKGRFVDGFEAGDLVLYDNNVPQTVQVDYDVYPISLVVAVQSSSNSDAILSKLGHSGTLFAQMLAGEGGETALLSFGDQVHLHQDFTTDSDELTTALRGLKVEGDNGVALDGVMEALRILRARPANRRRIILMIAEKRVRGNTAKLQEVIQEVQRQNALIYWLTYSPSLAKYTARPKKINCDRWGKNCENEPGGEPMNLLAGLTEAYHLSSPDVSELFTKATGARTFGFLKQSALENAIQSVGAEVHRQYILSFQAQGGTAGVFHPIRVEVKDRPDLQVRTRAGYWTVQ